MAKIFRIHKKGDGEPGWFNSTAPSPTDLTTITSSDKNGKVATSIPSPFARVDLVKTAFKFVADSKVIKGDSNNHKLISEALDVGQLFFYFNQVKVKYPNAEILAWDPSYDLNKIKNVSSSNLFGETLELFWKQDKGVYNYDKVRRLFIIKIDHQVVGATSPSNLFFAASDVSNLNLDFKFGNVQLFNSVYESLAERDDEFIRYIYALSNQSGFSANFPELYDYLLVSLDELRRSRPNLWNEVNSYNQSTYNSLFKILEIEPGNPVEVLGIPLGCNKPTPDWIHENSDFAITPMLPIKENEFLPLVLPTTKFFENWVYTQKGSWDSETNVPENESTAINNRILPGQADTYPFLTLGDFLEESLIRLPYKLNDKQYHSLGLQKHLIPLKPLFFKYFTVHDLVASNMLTIYEGIDETIQVTLKIPTRKGSITYKKDYFPRNISDRDFHFGFFPTIKSINDNIKIDYHIGVIDQNTSLVENIQLNLFRNDSQIDSQSIESVIRKEKSGDSSSQHFKTQNSFDYLRLSTKSNCSGLIIPIFKNIEPKPKQAKVAVDFGTTNTHIEYKYDNSNEQALDLKELYASLGKEIPTTGRRFVVERLLNMELIPNEITKGAICSFPLRTALLENNSTNWSSLPQPFLDTNVAYFYEGVGTQQHHNIITDLKWRILSNPVDKLKISHFIEGVLETIKIKLLADGITFNNLEIFWLYPVSMTKFQLGGLEEIWKKAVNKVFNQDIKLSKIPESIAPYNYYDKNMGMMGLTASIDIGGGTSDITVFEKSGPSLISSINFAGNSVVGDGYNSNIRLNGFVNVFEPVFRSACENKTGGSEKASILDQIKNGIDPTSTNFCSFLFSVEDGLFNFTEHIKSEPNLKLLYVLFYSVQAYYLANLIKRIGSPIPDNIIFSGSGSKSLDIIDFADRTLTKELFEFFFKKIFNTDKVELNIKMAPVPKEITSKGALESTGLKVNDKVGFWSGQLNSGQNIFYQEKEDVPTFNNAIDERFKSEVLDSIKHFYQVFDEYSRSCNLNATFGINKSALDKFIEIRDKNIIDFMDKGIEQKLKSAQGKDDKLTEGLFFYPFVGILNRLGTELAQQLNSNKE
jgi:hypothetical protein